MPQKALFGFLVLLLTFFSLQAAANHKVVEFAMPLDIKFQSAPVNITGKVASEAGDPLPGVTVLLKGSTIGTTTAPRWQFQLNGSQSSRHADVFIHWVLDKRSADKRTANV